MNYLELSHCVSLICPIIIKSLKRYEPTVMNLLCDETELYAVYI